MLIKDVMTRMPTTCKPSDTLDKVAKLMLERDCGEIPVVDGTSLLGVITDRDIVCRAVAVGKSPAAVPASDVMTHHVYTIGIHDDLNDALELMEHRLVRRLPVVDEAGTIVGIVSQADLIAKVPTLKVARALRTVSQRTRHSESAL